LDRLLCRHQRRLAFGKSNWTDTTGATTGEFDLTGALAGGTVGYNVQTGSWVWGFEADGAASGLKGTDAAACC
jgi:outer membrane immunogenic protein